MDPIELVGRLGRWATGRGPLYALLAGRLRQLIDDGDLGPGVRLPPDRAFAAALSVGRSTVVAAYSQLIAEGRIVRRQGSGTRVAGTPVSTPHETTGAPVFLHLLEPQDDTIMLACAAPVAPPPELAAAYAAVLPQLAAYPGIGYHPTGVLELRQALADRYTERGRPTHLDQILVTNGGQQALSLLARSFIAPGDPVLLEAPTYPGALEVFREQAAKLHPLPVGLEGFEAAVRRHRPAVAYVVPVFQNPTGAVLGSLQRQHLAAVAHRNGFPLVEDEILADLAFPGSEPPAAGPDSVISVGSLSKALWGGLRIGWLRAPEPVIARLARLRAVQDLGGNVPTQLAASVLIAQLDELCRRRAAELKTRHDLLLAELANALPEWTVPPVAGGQTLWIRLPYGDAASYAQAALREGVAVLPGEGLDAGGGSRDYVRVHFQAEPVELVEGVRRMAAAWQGYRPPDRRITGSPALTI